MFVTGKSIPSTRDAASVTVLRRGVLNAIILALSLLFGEYGVDGLNWLFLKLVKESPIPQDIGTKFGIACLLFATGKSIEQSHTHAREIAERDAKNAQDLERFRESLKDDFSREVVRLFQNVPPAALLQHVLGASGSTPEAQGFLAELARVLNAQTEQLKPVALRLLSTPLQGWAQDLQLVATVRVWPFRKALA